MRNGNRCSDRKSVPEPERACLEATRASGVAGRTVSFVDGPPGTPFPSPQAAHSGTTATASISMSQSAPTRAETPTSVLAGGLSRLT